jgi:hypothetical protein
MAKTVCEPVEHQVEVRSDMPRRDALLLVDDQMAWSNGPFLPWFLDPLAWIRVLVSRGCLNRAWFVALRSHQRLRIGRRTLRSSRERSGRAARGWLA